MVGGVWSQRIWGAWEAPGILPLVSIARLCNLLGVVVSECKSDGQCSVVAKSLDTGVRLRGENPCSDT